VKRWLEDLREQLPASGPRRVLVLAWLAVGALVAISVPVFLGILIRELLRE